MRKKDIQANNGKAAKTINFDAIVLERLEYLADKQSTKVSSMVNSIIRSIVMTDARYYRQMAKEHYLKFQEMKYMEEQVLAKEETK